MQYPQTLNSKDFCTLALKVKAKVMAAYTALGLLNFSWGLICRVASYTRDRMVTDKHSLTYFLVRDPFVFKYLINYYKEAGHKELIEALDKYEAEKWANNKIYTILQGELSDIRLFNKYGESRRNPSRPVYLDPPYHAIFQIYANGIELPENAVVAALPPATHYLAFEVLYHSFKDNKVKSFDLIFDKKEGRVEAIGFHKPLSKKYTIDGFELPKGNKLILDLTREKSKETLHLDINLGSYDLEEANYFSGTYIGTSFTTGKCITGTIYLLRQVFLSNGYEETRATCRLKLEQKLNLQPPSRSIDVLNPLEVKKKRYHKKNREEILEEHIGVYLACNRKKEKKGAGNYMRVGIFTLDEAFKGEYILPGDNQRDAYKCNIEFSESTLQGQEAISLKLTFKPPNDPFMFAIIGIPRENDEYDKNKLQGRFCTLDDGGGIVLRRVEEGAPIEAMDIDMDHNQDAIFDEIWDMLAELNSPFSE